MQTETWIDKVFLMPRMLGAPFYPGGYPLHFGHDNWRGNVKEALIVAIRAYYDWVCSDIENGVDTRTESLKPNADQFDLMRQYAIYQIHAPIWAMNPYGSEGLEQLRNSACQIEDWPDLETYLDKALEFGIDPF